MKTKNILLGMVAMALSAALTGCYEKFDAPAPQKIYEDQWFADNNYTEASIADIKQLFEDNVGKPTNAATYDKHYVIVEPYYIKGKVVSNDAFGNFYRNLYIQDDTGGIEVKVGISGLYSKYLTGETIYVVCQDLAVGNYRKNLSLGLPDLSGEYGTKNIEVKYLIDVHLKQGPRTTMAKADTLVLNASNIGSYVSGGNIDVSLSGKLVRLEGAVSTWTAGKDGYPSFLENLNDVYTTYSFAQTISDWQAYRNGTGKKPSSPEPANNYQKNPAPSWAFQEYDGTNKYYGSAQFYVGNIPIIIRTSGYSRFALDPVPADGEVVDITGIINLYTDKRGNYPANQLMINTSGDVK